MEEGSHQLLGVVFTRIWRPWEEEGSLDEDACHLTLGPLGCGEFQMLISFLKRCFIFRDNSPGLWRWGWSLTRDFLRCLRLRLALTLHPLPSSGSSSFLPARGEASPPGLVLGLLPTSARNTSTLSTLCLLPHAPTCSKSSLDPEEEGPSLGISARRRRMRPSPLPPHHHPPQADHSPRNPPLPPTSLS